MLPRSTAFYNIRMFFTTVFLLVTLFTQRSTTCSFPSDLTGQWLSTSFGTLTFTNTTFSGFQSGISPTPIKFTCYEKSNSRYLTQYSYSLFGTTVNVYLCMDLTRISAIKYFFTLNSDLDVTTGLRFYATDAATVTMEEACAGTNKSPGEYELLIKEDNLTDAFSDCPSGLRSTFDVTMSTSSVSNCNGSSLTGSAVGLDFNYSSCVTGALSNIGYYRCLYSRTSTYTYVILYDNDTSATNEYTCMAFLKTDHTVQATQYSGSCQHNQTHVAVSSPGVTYVMTDLLYTTEKTDYTVVIVVFCVVLGVIIIAAIIIILYCKVFRRPKVPESPEPKKPKRKLSVTEYTPRTLGRSLSKEKEVGVLSKQSTGEVLTGILKDKKNKAASLNVDAYEPAKKEVWQKKWENSPRTMNGSLQTMRRNFSSDGGKLDELKDLKLDQANVVSTSLPENLDASKIKRGQNSVEKLETETTNIAAVPKYSEKSHAAPAVPRSTGKFGGSPRITSFDSIPFTNVEQKLNTISENPFSRENTTASLKQKKNPFKELQKSLRIQGADVASISTVVGSTGTASVGDISFQNSFQNFSRSSHISASNASIFDDPMWLHDNMKNTDATFERIHNLEASVPKPKGTDPKWFLKSPKQAEISREDIDYFRNRNSSYVGLNSSLNKGKWSSVEIIARELKKRKEAKEAKEAKNKKKKTRKTNLVRPKPAEISTRNRMHGLAVQVGDTDATKNASDNQKISLKTV